MELQVLINEADSSENRMDDSRSKSSYYPFPLKPLSAYEPSVDTETIEINAAHHQNWPPLLPQGTGYRFPDSCLDFFSSFSVSYIDLKSFEFYSKTIVKWKRYSAGNSISALVLKSFALNITI